MEGTLCNESGVSLLCSLDSHIVGINEASHSLSFQKVLSSFRETMFGSEVVAFDILRKFHG